VALGEYTVHVDGDARLWTFEEIRAGVEAPSPMFDNVRNATPAQRSIETQGGT
jgi:putative redox protein